MQHLQSTYDPWITSCAVQARWQVVTAENIFLAGWLLLMYQDTVYNHLVPMAGLLRLIVPVMFVGVLLSATFVRGSRVLKACLFLFTVVASASALSGVSPVLALIKLALFLAMVVPVVLCPRILQAFYPGSRGLELLFLGGVVLVGLNLFYQLVRSQWVLWNPNMVAMLTVCVLPILLFYSSYARTNCLRIISTGGVVLCIAVALMTKARAGIYADLCIVLIYLGFRFSKSINAVVVVMAVVGALGFGFANLIDPVRESAAELAYKGERRLVDEVRLLKFDESMEAFSERPLLGYGFGLSWQVEPSHIDYALRTGRLSGVVGEFGSSTLALLVGGGALLTVVFYFMVVAILLSGLRGLRMCARGSLHYSFLTAMLAGVVGLIVHAQAEGWILSPLNWISPIFWLYCGLTVSFAEALRRVRQRNSAVLKLKQL